MSAAALLPTPASTEVAHLGTVLGVWAHPDDETLLSGGLLATVRARGQRVVVLTATRGERGTNDPRSWPPERLAAVRCLELTAALAELGVVEHAFLGDADGACSRMDAVDRATRVAVEIDRVRPDTIVTFGPDGITGHDDHRAVHGWTTRAWQLTGRRARLLYAAVPVGFHHRWRGLHDRLSLFYPGFPVEVPADDLTLAVRAEGDVLARKVAALHAHASQMRRIEDVAGAAGFQRWWSRECFVEARVPLSRTVTPRPPRSATRAVAGCPG